MEKSFFNEKALKDRIDELNSFTLKNRYIVGYDALEDRSEATYCIWDRKKHTVLHTSNKQWKVVAVLIIAKAIGWEVIKEIN